MKNIVKIIKVARPLYRLLGIIGFLIVITAVMEQLAPVLSKYIVDEIVLQVQNGTGDIQRLFLMIALAFIANMLTTVISSISDRLGDHLSGELRKYLIEKFYTKTMTLSQSYFDSELSGKILNQLNRGIETIKGFSGTATNFILPTFLQSVITIGLLAYYNWQTAVFTFSLFPIYTVITYYSTKKWGEEEVKKNKHSDISSGRIQEVISNIKVVKGFTNEIKELKFISKEQATINKIYGKQSRTFHIFDFVRNTSLNVILLAINVVVFYTTFQGNLSLGEMVLIIQLVAQARRPLFAMSFILTQIQMAESGSKEFFEILELESTEDFEEIKNFTRIEKAEIEFRNIFFKYDTSDDVLKDISFKIEPGEKIALVGPSGAGKSTIINLILKFYQPYKGDILLNGSKYSDLPHSQIRKNTSLVFQDNELFSTTIKDNVSYGLEASKEEIIDALKKANAYDFVKKFKKGINTEVGERGIRLSGGQKQRIQIARAILNDAPILLLDEATSSLDSKSEKEVQDAMERLMEDKLVIIIAHRLSTVQNVDRIFVIDEGRIVDSGAPAELAQRPGIYSDLLRYQVEGNEKLLKSFELY
ncbi:ABC transporter ATP-binding protein [Candidatus Dojkabacteria bacterium]|uniref:ABC transporter ATP-binding protein n=1 Tax=Candidatus Dojkabacteria bacterium TaxID=2099670 RepID=A0A955L4W2_9BACT|nr:ABC transporter ATP-binding protein [Candidatus Dojkabacteria bacterium]